MKYFCIAFLLFISVAHSNAQRISAQDMKSLKQKEDSMKPVGIKLIQGISVADRFRSDSLFTKMLVRALKTKNSFYYPFDSLYTISKLYAPDSSFRIYTWQMMISDNLIRQHGAIQMKTTDGSLKLFPLIDKSDVTSGYEDTVGNHLGWMGAVYYKVVLTQHEGKKYYTLLGYDENNIRSNKKIIEVMRFENDQPIFGGRFFSAPNNSLLASNPSRYVMEFKKEAGPRLTYDDELNMIIMEHLVSESNQPNKKWTLVGDGDYEGFRWIQGKWVYVAKVFNEVTPEGKAPVPTPIRDEKGTIDESKLRDNNN